MFFLLATTRVLGTTHHIGDFRKQVQPLHFIGNFDTIDTVVTPCFHLCLYISIRELTSLGDLHFRTSSSRENTGNKLTTSSFLFLEKITEMQHEGNYFILNSSYLPIFHITVKRKIHYKIQSR